MSEKPKRPVKKPVEKPTRKPVEKPQDVEPLDQYLRRMERLHIDRDVVAVTATHPDAINGTVWKGTYGGVRLSVGKPGMKYSDGTTAN